MRSQYIFLVAFFLPLFGVNSFAQSNNFHVQVQYYGHWINGDRIGDGTSLPDPTFRLWTNLHTGSQSGQSNGNLGSNYYWLHLPNTNCYDCYYNSPITLINTNVNVPGPVLNLSDGFFFNLRLECHENDDGNNETVGGGDDWVENADHNRRIQIDPNASYPVVQEYTFATNGINGNDRSYEVRIRITVHRLDAFAPTLRYTNSAGVSQNLFCSGDPMRIYADYNANFSGGIFEWQGSNDNGANWYTIQSTTQNYLSWTANNPMPLIRCRLVRPCPSSVFGSQALNCVGTISIPFPPPLPSWNFPDINVNAGSGGTSDGWISNQGVPITVGPPPPDPNAIITNVTNTCQGTLNGSINVQVASISPSYTYSLTLERSNGNITVSNHTVPGGSSSINHTFTGLSADTYNVKVTLRNGDNTINCTSQKNNIVVGVNPLPVVSATGTAGACFGQNGRVVVDIIQHSIGNSVQGFQLYDNSGFNLLDQFYATSSSWTFFRQPGTYKVRAINGNNCTSAFVDVVIPNPPSAVTAGIGTDNFGGTGNQIQCNGSTGEIRVTPSGGTPNYNISVSGGGGWNGAGSGQTTNFQRPAGTYSITITDSRGCTYNPPNVTLNEPPALSVNVNTTPTGVCVSTGTATFNGQGGVGPYTYRLNFSGEFSNNNQFSNLGVGDYTAFVRDVTGCERSVVFTISPLPPLQVSASNVTPVVCFGDNTGSVTLAGTGGKPPYQYALENGPFGSNNVFGSLTAATYTFRIRDADFCESQSQITVSTPDALLVGSHIFELGDCGSTIRPTVLTITGRAPGTPLEISTDNGGSWNPLTEIAPQNGNIRTRLNLSAGNYTIRVRAVAGGCQSNNYALAVPQGVLLGISQAGLTHETCAGDNDGSISAGLQGDVQPYTVRLFRINGTTPNEVVNSGAINTASHTFNNLQPGNYAVWVTNPAGCGEGLPVGFMGTGPYSGATITINARPALAASPASTGSLINCYGNNGVITVNNTTGGLPPYEYRLNDGAYQSNNVLTGALASNQVYVRDANQCMLGPLAVNIALSPANNTLAVTPVLLAPRTANCNDPGDPDFGKGRVRVDLSGGTGPYEVKLIPVGGDCQAQYATVTATHSTSITFTALEAGDYIACVRDAGGCTSNPTINVPLLPALTIGSINVTSTNCLNETNGAVTAQVSGGTPPYTVTLNNGGAQTVAQSGGSFTYTGLEAGGILLSVTDARGCTFSVERIVPSQSNLVVATSQTNISPCSYSDNGVLGVTPSGGVAPYTVTWLWDNTVQQNVAQNSLVQRTGLPIGSYSVRVSDASGCQVVLPFGLQGPGSVTISTIAVTDAQCSTVANGTLTVQAVGGTGALEYSIGGAFQSSGVFTGLAGGSYTITVRDQSLCQTQQVVEIGVALVLFGNAVPTHPNCTQALTGAIQVVAVGGQPPYTYSLNGATGPFTSTLTGLGAGTYTVMIQDNNGCQHTLPNPVTLTDPALLTASAQVVQDASCALNRGNLQASANGGTPGTGGYTFVWDANPALNNATYNNAPPGPHTVVVTDANGCTAMATATISNIPPLGVPNLQGLTPDFCGRNDGTITVAPQGGAGPFQYAWSHNANLNANTATGLPSGPYSVTVTDANNCTATLSGINVPATPALTLTLADVQNSLCQSGQGSITVQASAAPGPFTYTWSHDANLNSPVANNLVPDTYTVTATDANGCTATRQATITLVPSPAFGTPTTTASACMGSTGTMQAPLQANLGTPPFQYAWSHNANLNANTANNLATGAYSVTVTDANGCTATVTGQVGELPGPQVGVNTTASTCAQANGTATASATGGTAPYTYTWSHGAPNAATAQNLLADNYTVTVTDFYGCQAAFTFAVGNISGPTTLEVQYQNTLCQNGNGSITVAPQGGTMPYQYAWSHNALLNAPTATGLSAGSYTVTVTDANNCSLSTTQGISLQSPPTIHVVQQLNSRCTNGNGLIEVAPVGNGPFQYTWTNNVSTGPLAQNLNVGGYTVTVTDANGCTATRSFSIALQPAPFATATTTPTACQGNTGTASVNVQGGTGPFQYAWSHDANLNSPSASNLLTGGYTVTVTDVNGCTATATAQVGELPGPQAQVTPTGANCSEATGTATAVVSGGTMPYTYTWANGAPSAPTATGLAGGPYGLTVTDAFGCTATANFTISDTPALTALDLAATDSFCEDFNGSLAAAPQGGTAPYQYAWSHDAGLSANTAANLPQGNYTVTVTDANGCTFMASEDITLQSAPTAVAQQQANSLCTDGNGLAEVAATGNGPFQYTWSHDAGLSANIAGNLPQGNYTVTVTDANGCTATVGFDIALESAPTAVANATPAACGTDNGTVQVQAQGGTGTLQYAWSHEAGLSANAAAGLPQGSYTVTVTDANGCTAIATAQVDALPGPQADVTPTTATCGQANGEATANVTGGTAPYAYAWTGGAPDAPTAADLAAGDYGLTVTDAYGCSATVGFTVPGTTPPQAEVTQVGAALCGAPVGTITVQGMGGLPPYTYAWSHEAGLSANVATDLPQGNYTITVTDANQCSTEVSADVEATPVPTLALMDTQDDPCLQNDVSIIVNGMGSIQPLQYTWSHNAGLNSPQATGLPTGQYAVTVTDANGCTASLSIAVTDQQAPTLGLAEVMNSNCNQADGSISVIGTGGTSPYGFTWSHNAGLNSPQASNLTAGNYAVTLTDANSCTATATAAISDTEAPQAAATVTASACGGNTGTATIVVEGGVAPYNYAWAHAPQLQGPMAGQLAVGAYSVTITDGNGCVATVNLQISELPGPAATVEAVTAFCSAANGTATAIATGGTMPYTYAWGAGTANGAEATSLLPGIYTLTVTDAFGCQATVPYAIGNVAGPTALNLAATDSFCEDFNGSLTATPQGGTAPYQYIWSHDAGLAANAAANLPQGNYTVTVTDANGCTLIASEIITLQGTPTAVAQQQANSLCTDGNGLAEVAATGNGPFQYTWSHDAGLAANIAGNLLQGSYTVTVTDANGCTATVGFDISLESAPTAVANATPAACGADNGTVQVQAQGGTGTLQYAWSHNSGLAANAANNLPQGSYTVTVTDANGCTATATTQVGELPALTALDLATTDSFCEDFNGSLTATPQGGTAPYQYAWSHDAGLSANAASNLPQGTYTVTVTDVNGCTFTATQDIVLQSPPTLVGQQVFNSVCTDGNGFIQVDAVGNGVLTYIWTNNVANGPLATSLAAGLYTLTLTDGNGCVTTHDFNITLTEGLAIALEQQVADQCGQGVGLLSLDAVGGQPPFQYTWAHNPNLTGAVAAGLTAGQYGVTVTDGNGCTSEAVFLLSDEDGPQAAVASQVDALCTPDNGALTVVATGGQSPYTYTWSHNAALNAGSATGLAPGSYAVTIVDAVGCTAVVVGEVGFTAPPTVSADVTDALCQPDNGAIQVAVQGGTAPYQIAWGNPAATGFNPTQLMAGDYAATVTDALGCSVELIESVQYLVGPEVALAEQQDAACGQLTGYVQVTATGGQGPYQYAWSHNPALQLPMAQELAAGVYTVVVTDANGCEAALTTTLSEVAGPAVSLATANSACAQQNGSAEALAVGGTPPLEYSWSHNAALQTASASGLAAGIYTITVTDLNGCAATATATVADEGGVALSVAAYSDAICDANSGAISLAVSGGQAPYNYLWAHNTALNAPEATGLGAGTYTVTVSDANGCQSVVAQALSFTAGPTLALQSAVNSLCADGNGALTFAPLGGVAPFAYTWAHDANLDIATAAGLSAGPYALTVADANGCVATQAAEVLFVAGPQASIATQTDDYCDLGTGAVTLQVQGGTAPLQYTWAHNATIDAAAATGLQAGTYAATVTDANGCMATVSATLAEVPGFGVENPAVQAANCGAADGQVQWATMGGQPPFQYTWGHDGALTGPLAGNLLAGAYSVTVMDAGGCLRTATAEVQSVDGPVVSVAGVVDATCGASNGQAGIAITGGQPPYAVLWNNGLTNETANELAAGSYQITVTDANNCQGVTSVTLGGSPALALEAVSVQAAVCSASNGTATVVGVGGTPPYNYIWGQGQEGGTANGLAAGTYTVTATDAAGCVAELSVLVNTEVNNPTAVILGNTPSGCNEATGVLSVGVEGGAPPYAYAWAHNNALADAEATGLAAGGYTVIVSDANGCAATLQANISEAGAPEVTVQAQPAWCGQAVGSATVQGPGDYVYAWENTLQPSLILSQEAQATGLVAGTYRVTVSNDDGCTTVQTVAIEDLPDMVLATEAVPVACFGAAVGEASVTVVSGGTGPFTFQWGSGQAEENIGGLAVGVYTVTATDANGCVATATATVNGPTPVEVTLTASAQPFCDASNDGSLGVQANGGTAPYQYAWASGQQTADISGLAPGTYSLTVTDANQCQAIFETSLAPSDGVALAIQATAQSCVGTNNGQATAVATGQGALTYQWSVPGGPTGGSVANLAPGTYSLTVTDEAGCTAVEAFEIPAATPIALTVATTPSCLNTLNGTAMATASGGAGGFSYVWSNAAQGETLDNLLPGPLSVTVTDANGCTAAQGLFLPGAPFPTLEVVGVTQPTCDGQVQGSAQVMATGGTGVLTYQWGDPLGQTTATAGGLAAGAYTVTATDENGCFSTASVDIMAPESFTANVTALVRPSCVGSANGSATVGVQGGSGQYAYQWDDPTAQATAQATGLAAGSYTVTITDLQSGCVNTLPLAVQDPPALTLSVVGTTAVLCAGQSNGTAQVLATGGTGPSTYLWSDPAAQGTAQATGLAAGTYTVGATDANGCTTETEVVVSAPDALVANIGEAVGPLCFGQGNGTATVTATGGTGVLTYLWNDPSLQTGMTATGLTAGAYTVTVQDANLCTTTAEVSLTAPPQIDIVVESQANPTCAGAGDGQVVVTATGGTGALGYLWTNGAAMAQLTNLAGGQYTLSVTDANLCVRTINVNLVEPAALVVANASVNPATCYSGADGGIALTVQGGTGTLSYQWDDPAAQTAATATGLVRGTYQVTATDTNGCELVSSFNVGSLGQQIVLTTAISNASCEGAANATVTLGASGGAGGFSFAWSGGQTGGSLSGLGAGDYAVTATDAQGCTEAAAFTVADGVPLLVDIGPADTTLCDGEVLFVDFTGAGYTVDWSGPNGFSSQNALTMLEATGTYYLQVANAQGCVAYDTLQLTVSSDPLQAFFVMATDVVVGQEVVALEASWPEPQEVEWIFPIDSVEFVQKLGDRHIFRFLHPGHIRMGMKGILGNCEDWIFKTITVHADSTSIPGLNPDEPDILGVTIAPNPNNGVFSARVQLSAPMTVVVSLYDASGVLKDRRVRQGQSIYDENYSLTNAPGMYVLLVQSPKQRRSYSIQVMTP